MYYMTTAASPKAIGSHALLNTTQSCDMLARPPRPIKQKHFLLLNCHTTLHLVLVVSNVPGLAAAGGAAGRVAAAPEAAPLPMLLLPPPPRRRLSSSSSVRALLSRILKKRASRLQVAATRVLDAHQSICRTEHGDSYTSCMRVTLSGNLPPQRKADECNPEVPLRPPLLAHASRLNQGAVCLRANMEASVLCKLLSCLQGCCRYNIH